VLVDANLLLYARNADDPHHQRARDWLGGALNGPVRVGLPWLSLSAFLRISSNPRAWPRVLSISEAWEQVEDWLAAPASWIPLPTDRHAEVLGRLLLDHRLSSAMVTDAQLAALAVEHGVAVASTDTGFARFTEIRWIDPLAD
jgi:toxin-antitoxin system PIN domain toxin